MIWIIGGTKDSRIILDDIVVSTATEYGGKLLEDVTENKRIHIISERLGVLQIENLILEKNID